MPVVLQTQNRHSARYTNTLPSYSVLGEIGAHQFLPFTHSNLYYQINDLEEEKTKCKGERDEFGVSSSEFCSPPQPTVALRGCFPS